MNEKWSMEEMGTCIKNKYICSLSGSARPKGSDASKNNYRPGSSVCFEPDRFDTRFYSSHRLPGRPYFITIRDLVMHSPYTSRGVAGISGIGDEADVRTTSQSSRRYHNYHHLVFGNSSFHAVAICQRNKKHLTNRSCGPKIGATDLNCFV